MARTAKNITVVFDITQYDINHGQQENGSGCPIYKAIKRALKGRVKKDVLKSLSVTSAIDFHLREGLNVEYFNAELSKKARKFIDLFDAEGKKAVKPFTFKAKLPISVFV